LKLFAPPTPLQALEVAQHVLQSISL
jgi:hypothetical protein